MKLRRENEKKGLAKFFYMLKLKWKFGVPEKLYNLREGIKNLIVWFPTVWKHRTWDGDYTISILVRSLELQRDRLRDHSREIDETLFPKIADIETVIRLLKKTQDEFNYTQSIYDHYDSIYGEDEMYFEPFKKTQEDRDALGEFDDPGDTLYTMKTTREDKLGEEEYEKYRTEKMEKLIKAEEERDADRKRAFQIIAENIESWWE